GARDEGRADEGALRRARGSERRPRGRPRARGVVLLDAPQAGRRRGARRATRDAAEDGAALKDLPRPGGRGLTWDETWTEEQRWAFRRATAASRSSSARRSDR